SHAPPMRPPFPQGPLVVAQHLGALPVEAHPVDQHSREHSNAEQVHAKTDADRDLPSLAAWIRAAALLTSFVSGSACFSRTGYRCPRTCFYSAIRYVCNSRKAC